MLIPHTFDWSGEIAWNPVAYLTNDVRNEIQLRPTTFPTEEPTINQENWSYKSTDTAM